MHVASSTQRRFASLHFKTSRNASSELENWESFPPIPMLQATLRRCALQMWQWAELLPSQRSSYALTLTIPRPDPPPTFDNSDTRFPLSHSSSSHSTGFGITDVTSYLSKGEQLLVAPEKCQEFVHFVGYVEHNDCQQYGEVDVGDDVADELDNRRPTCSHTSLT